MYKAFGEDSTLYTEDSVVNMISHSADGLGVQLRAFQYAINRIKLHPELARIYIHKPGPLPQDKDYLLELSKIYTRGLMEVDSFINKQIAEEKNHDI